MPTEYDSPVRVEWKVMGNIRVEEPTVSNVELAKRVGVNVNTITRWLRDPHYQRYENFLLQKEFDGMSLEQKEAHADVQDILKERSPEMIERLYGIIQMTGDVKLEADLCRDWLDRGGHVAQRKPDQSNIRAFVLTAEAAEVFMRRAKEAKLIVEGEVAG